MFSSFDDIFCHRECSGSSPSLTISALNSSSHHAKLNKLSLENVSVRLPTCTVVLALFAVFLDFVFILKPNNTFSVLKCDNMCTVHAKECCWKLSRKRVLKDYRFTATLGRPLFNFLQTFTFRKKIGHTWSTWWRIYCMGEGGEDAAHISSCFCAKTNKRGGQSEDRH